MRRPKCTSIKPSPCGRALREDRHVRLAFVRLFFGLLLGSASLGLADPAVSSSDHAAEAAAREQAIAEAIKAQEARKKHIESTTPEQRAAERERANRLPRASDGYNWRSVVADLKLTPAEIDQLARQKVMIGRGHYLQSFEPYTESDVPVFITSDSLLNAYHRLFEDSFRELEIRRGPLLRAELEATIRQGRELMAHPPGPASDLAPGWLQAQRSIGPAMVLLGTSPDFFDRPVRDDIQAEVAKIRSATAVELPRWLGAPSPGLLAIDYRRMKPVGIYNVAPLDDYFRAVRWLQIVPFRAERDEDLTAFALLGASVSRHGTQRNFFGAYTSLLGPTDDNGIKEAVDLISRWSENESWQEWLAWVRRYHRPKPPRVKEDLRSANDPATVAFHFLSGYVLPDSDFFQQLSDHHEPITGLHLAAMVDSEWAASRLGPNNSAFLSETLKAVRRDRMRDRDYGENYGTLYEEYLDTLSSLFAAPDPDAPAFMTSDAWSAKTCQTCLSSWVQQRHSYVLQAKIAMSASAAFSVPAGLIEPNPDFLQHFAALVAHTRERLAAGGAFSRTPASMAARVRTRAELLNRAASELAPNQDISDLPNSLELESVIEGTEILRELPDSRANSELLRDINLRTSGTALPAELCTLRDLLLKTADEYEKGERALPDEPYPWTTLDSRWSTLQSTASRLEVLLQKQFRHRPWTPDEQEFFKGYGFTLARAMGCMGAPAPRDDSPRCVEVFRDAARDASLTVAVGRPQAIYVLYPWDGIEILCRGTVMPYYEFNSPDRLTDAEWKQRLDSSSAPAQPDWLKTVRSVDAK